MLANLTISNFIIFDQIEVDFFKGFNAFTGETGAGKSMIIDAVLQLLGEKANRNFVGTKKDTALVQGLFFIDDPKLKELITKNDIEYEEGSGIVISRKIYNTGRSTAKINGTLVNINFLKDIREFLIDVHGQYEQQSILDKEKHISILDDFIKEEISNTKLEYKNKYKELQKIKNRLKDIEANIENKEDRVDFLKFQINEIEKANLKENEEEELFSEHKYLSNIDKLNSNLNKASYMLNYSEESIVEQLSSIIYELSQISDLDEDIKKFEDIINDKYEEMKDLSYELKSYIENIEVDKSRLNKINNRLSTINELKRKYKMEIQDILKKKDDNIDELNKLEGLNKEYDSLTKDKDVLEEDMDVLANTMHSLRTNNAEKLEKSIKEELEELNEEFDVPRRTLIIDKLEEFDRLDLIQEEDVVITITHRGFIKRVPESTYRTQRRGGKGMIGLNTVDNDFVHALFLCSTHDKLLLFTNKGKVHLVNTLDIPEMSRTARGLSLANLVMLENDEKIVDYVTVNDFETDKAILFATKEGYVKRTKIEEFSNIPREV